MLWLERKFLEGLLWLVLASGAGWILTLAYKGLTGQPVLYAYGNSLSGEAIALGCLAASMFLLFFYGAAGFLLAGNRLRFWASALVAPWVCGIATVVLAAWIYGGPNQGASYFPLSGIVVLSGAISYLTRWGALRERDRSRTRPGTANLDAQDVAWISRPKVTLASIHGNDTIKGRLKEAAQGITAAGKQHSRPRNGILLHGLPGNGKTAFAEALAGELGLPLVTLTYADVASQWVGEKSARVRAAFEQARRQQPCVLFIDEVDSFLESRDGRPDGVKEDRDLVNAMLTLMVDIRQSRVILIAATNHMDRLDSAGVREGRFDFKVEITPPDLPARVGLLKKGLRENLPSVRVEDAVIQSVAERWNGFSVKRILAVAEELPSYTKAKGLTAVGFEDFMGALRQVQGQRGHVAENVKRLDELIFSESTREMLDLIAARMLDPEHTERHGGTLPTGVLFYGPPGTGKTAACKALAREIGWAYLPSTGADLARDPKCLEALYAKAQDLRPTIIFIDEADELLRDRQFSGSTEATNKLLTLMDGVGDRVRDVAWIAATNNPGQIDPALLRGGRFTEKVVFELPSAQDLARYVEQWLERKKVVLDAGIGLDRIADVVGLSSIANAEAILQAAVNRAIARRQMPVLVRLEDFERASRSVMGGDQLLG